MSASEVDDVRQRGQPGAVRFLPLEGKRILGHFAVCCPMERPVNGGAASVVSEVHDLPPDTSDLQVWVAGWDCQFTKTGCSANAERPIAHIGVHAYAFRKQGQWFVQTSMILANSPDDTYWFGWVDLCGIAIG